MNRVSVTTRWCARVALSAVFVHSGVRVWREPDGVAEMSERLLRQGRRFVSIPNTIEGRTLVRVNAGIHVMAGASLAVGLLKRQAAGVLAATLVPTTIAAYPFWTAVEERGRLEGEFLKNLSVAGGLVAFIAAERALES